ncbi:UNVERIFIED_CONTAM: hypothetical protein K2H54_074906 [Gekko kuhli]
MVRHSLRTIKCFVKEMKIGLEHCSADESNISWFPFFFFLVKSSVKPRMLPVDGSMYFNCIMVKSDTILHSGLLSLSFAEIRAHMPIWCSGYEWRTLIWITGFDSPLLHMKPSG